MGASKRRIAGALALASSVAALHYGPATAQPNETTVVASSTSPTPAWSAARAGVAVASLQAAGADVGDAPAGDSAGPSGIVTGTIITGASSTVITAQEIEHSPGADIAGRAGARAGRPGAQPVRHGGTAHRPVSTCAGSVRAGTSNTLVLINGRRLNDIDMAGVDFSAIPKNSIERIEITRGNSGAVLYGDGAVGGVINIGTKNAGRPAAIGARAGGLRLVQLSGRKSLPRTRPRILRPGGSRRGLRQCDPLRRLSRERRAAPGECGRRSALDQRAEHHRLSQYLRRQPASRVARRPARDADLERTRGPTGAAPRPRSISGNKNGLNATLGVTHMLWQGTELVVDGGVRNRTRTPGSSARSGRSSNSGFKADLTSYSVTPRLLSQHMVGGMPGKLITGIDVYRSVYDSDRIAASGRSPNSPLRPEADDGRLLLPGDGRRTTRYRLRLRRPRAAQFHQCPRPVRSECAGRGVVSSAPNQGLPFDGNEVQYAWHVGEIEHRVTQEVAFFGRAARCLPRPQCG